MGKHQSLDRMKITAQPVKGYWAESSTARSSSREGEREVFWEKIKFTWSQFRSFMKTVGLHPNPVCCLGRGDCQRRSPESFSGSIFVGLKAHPRPTNLGIQLVSNGSRNRILKGQIDGREEERVMAEAGAKKRKMGERRQADSKKQSVKWPLIKPKQNLQIKRLKDTDLFTVPNFFTSAESKAFIEAAEGIGFLHQGSLGPTKGEAYRDNDRISVSDPVLASAIWESGLDKLFCDIKIRGKVAVGLNPNIRLYRYKIGQRFGRHIDESADLGEGKRTHYTLLIYLSGGVKTKAQNDKRNSMDSSSEPLVGGETVFYASRNSVVAEVAPTEGMALLHIHGDKCMLHEARNVTKGVKYVFRSDVAFA